MRHALALSLAAAMALAVIAFAVAATNRNYGTHLSTAEEIPPPGVVIDGPGQGQFIGHLSKDGTALEYKLIASNISNVVAAHIHLGQPGSNGPVVAFLFGPAAPGEGRTDGVLATGTITAANLVGPLAGHPLSDLIDAMGSGNTYANVHTNDGVAPTNTGPGDFPGGEIRGDIGANESHH